MLLRTTTTLLIVCFAVAGGAFADDKLDPREDLPMHMKNFRLPDLDGQMHELHSFSNSEAVVIFIQGVGCPIVRQTFPYLKQVRDTFEPKGVKFLMVNSNQYDDPPYVKEELTEFDVDMTTLKDPLQAFAEWLDLNRTAEFLVIDPQSWDIIYRGEADDRFAYGLQRSNPQKFYLRDVLTNWLADRSIPETQIRVTKGCLMNLAELPESVSFEADVAPILESLCTSCEHTDPEACISAWDEQTARNHADRLWNMLLMQQKPETACCEAGETLSIAPGNAHTLLAWLKQ